MPPATHSGGLRYHGMAPMVSHLTDLGLIEPKAYGQKECFEAGIKFANAEGIIPAPEATHAIKGAIDAALECKKNGQTKTILFNLCGHGHFDMKAYGDYFSNTLSEDNYNESEVNKALEKLPKVS
jgi:tryptophan synthase beta chain